MAAKKDDEFLIVNRRTGKALQATGLENGRPVCQAEITRSDAQVWYSTEATGGIKLTNKAASKVLDVMYGGNEDGTWAQTWEDVGGESQAWKLTGRAYKVISHVASGKVLDIENMSDEEGAHAQLWEDIGGENQQWKLVPLKEETVKVTKSAPKTAAKKTAAKKQTPAKKSAAVKTAGKQVITEKKTKTAKSAPKTAPKTTPKAASKDKAPGETAATGTAAKEPKKTEKKAAENEA